MKIFTKKTIKSIGCGLTLLTSGQAFATDYESIATSLSNFTDGTKWAVASTPACSVGGLTAVGTITPDSSDGFIICPGHTLTLDADYTFTGAIIWTFGTLDLSNATLTVPPNMGMAGIVAIGNAVIFGAPISSGLPNTGQLISGTRPHEFFILATAKGTQTQLGNSNVLALFVDTEALALSATTTIGYGILLSGSGTVTGTAKFTDGSMFGNPIIATDANKTIPSIDISAFTGTTGSGKTIELQGAFNNIITSLKLPTTLGTEIKFLVPPSQTLTINGTTGNSMSCTGSADAGSTTPNATPRTSAPFVFTASTAGGSTSTFVCTTVSLPISAPIDFSFGKKQVETYSTDIEIK
jgi:hypothetical protein